MPRSAETPSLSPYRRMLLAAEVVVLGGAALWSLVSPPPEAGGSKSQAERPAPVSLKKEAAILQRAARHGDPVPYNANVSVKWLAVKSGGNLIHEDTTAPLAYDAEPGVAGGDKYFTVNGHSRATLKVQPIRGVEEITPASWEPQHPGVKVSSHEGVINTNNAGDIPSTTIHLTDGSHENVAIAQTSAVSG